MPGADSCSACGEPLDPGAAWDPDPARGNGPPDRAFVAVCAECRVILEAAADEARGVRAPPPAPARN